MEPALRGSLPFHARRETIQVIPGDMLVCAAEHFNEQRTSTVHVRHRSESGYKEGEKELPSDLESLKKIRIQLPR